LFLGSILLAFAVSYGLGVRNFIAVLIATTILYYPIYFGARLLILYFHPVLVIYTPRYGRDIDFRITNPPDAQRVTEGAGAQRNTTPLILHCPLCGWQMRRCDVRADGFPCPGCKEPLRFADPPGGRFLVLGCLLAGYLLCYLAGARYNKLIWEGLILTYLLFFGTLTVHAVFFRKLVKDTRKQGDGFLHIVEQPGPPPPSKKQ
jgi:hypothetical protein